MRVTTWNINSLRSRMVRITEWIRANDPAVLLLQETKCSDAMFDELFAPAFAELGYESAHHGANHWNGVAILSRVGLADVRFGFPTPSQPPFDEPRIVSAVCGGVDVHSIYAPNGRSLDDAHYLYKLVWLERLRTVVDPARPTILAGDFNVAPADIDIYDPKRWRRRTHASPAERAAIEHLFDVGLVDVTRRHLAESGVFTWWNYRPGQFERNHGLRIDLALCTPDVAERTEAVWIDTAARADDHPAEKPSDHAPLVLDIAAR